MDTFPTSPASPADPLTPAPSAGVPADYPSYPAAPAAYTPPAAPSLPAVGTIGQFTLGDLHVGLIRGAAEALGIGGGHPEAGQVYPAIVVSQFDGLPGSPASAEHPQGIAAVPASITVEVFGLSDRLVTSAVPGSTEEGGFTS